MILVFGRTGQVATELARQARVTCLSRAEADLADPGACAAAIRDRAPEVVINAAFDSAAPTNPTGQPTIAAGRGHAPSSSMLSR